MLLKLDANFESLEFGKGIQCTILVNYVRARKLIFESCAKVSCYLGVKTGLSKKKARPAYRRFKTKLKTIKIDNGEYMVSTRHFRSD